MSSDPDARHPIEELAEQFLECYRRGERPEVADFTRRYPERSNEIHDLFAALVLLAAAVLRVEVEARWEGPRVLHRRQSRE